MRRRDFVAALGWAALGGASRVVRTVAAAPAKPDIVVIVADDMRTEDWNVLAQTQALLPGTYYDNYLMTTPVCGPSRASMLTGLYAAHHGIHSNDGAYHAYQPLERRSLAAVMQHAGYRTAIVGKYVNGYNGQAASCWDVNHAVKEPRYFIDHHYSTTVFGDQGVQFLQDPDPRPRLLWWAPKAPHLPATPDQPYRGSDHSAWAPDGGPNQDMDGKPKYIRDDGDLSAQERNKIQTIDDHRRETLKSVDDQIARLVHAQTRPCYFVVCSDNGFNLGEQNRVGKNIPYDPSLRCPLLLSGPGIARGRDATMVGNIDLVPTLLALAGIANPSSIDGTPFTRGHDAILIQGWAKPRDEGDGHLPNTTTDNPDWVGYRDAAITYVEYQTGEVERYDHRADPFEQRNLGPDPACASRLQSLRNQPAQRQQRNRSSHKRQARQKPVGHQSGAASSGHGHAKERIRKHPTGIPTAIP